MGAENQGWLVATHSLAHERLLSGNVAAIRSRMDALIDLATRRGATVAARRSIATLEARLLGCIIYRPEHWISRRPALPTLPGGHPP